MGNDLESQQPSINNHQQDNIQLQTPTEFPVLSRSVSCTAQPHPSNLNRRPREDDIEDKREPEEGAGPDYPEGGKDAWLVVFGSFISMVSSFGVMNTIAVLHTHLSQNQLKERSNSDVGWIFGMYVFLSFFGGIYIGPLFDRYGPRWLLLAGSVCIVGGLMLTSICTEYYQFMLAFGVMSGMGTCLIFTPAVASIGHWFMKRRGYATGVATTGGSVGGIIFPLIFQSATPKYGFGWAMRIIGFVALVFLTFGNCLIRGRDLNAAEKPAPSANPSTASSSVDDSATVKTKQEVRGVKIDLKAFKSVKFSLTTMGVFLIEWGLFVPLTYITSYAMNLGMPEAFSYQLLVVLNVGSVFGRWLPGLVADRFGRFNTMCLTVTLCLVCIVGLWLPSMYVTGMVARKTILVLFTLIYGFGSGSGISLTPVCVGQICDVREYGTKFGTCYFFVAFGTLTGIPIAGEIVTRMNGEYTGLVAFCAASYIGALLCFGSARIVGGGKKWNTIY